MNRAIHFGIVFLRELDEWYHVDVDSEGIEMIGIDRKEREDHYSIRNGG